MPKHMTIINLACTITKLRKWGQAWKYSAESAQNAASQLTAEHERKLTEHRAAFGARTEADAKIIEGLRADVDDLRNRMNSLGLQAAKQANIALGMVEGEGLRAAAQRVVKERDALRTECDDLRRVFSLVHGSLGIQQGEHIGNAIDALKKERDELATRLRQSIARGDFAEMRLATLAAELETERERHRQTAAVPQSVDVPRTHPVPCDPPEATHITPDGKATAQAAVTPQPGDVVRLVRVPSRSDVSPKLQTTLEWPWIERWGTLNQTALVVEPAYQLAGAVSVCLSANVHARWPICCVEVVRTEPDDIKVGDLVEVFQSSSTWTFTDDVGKSGTITRIETDPVSRTEIVHLREHPDDAFALCDVRKVTT